VMTQ
jgi:hypothetical protein